MNIKLVILGILTLDPFGVSWLKDKVPVHETIDLSGVGTDENLSFGPVTLGASIVVASQGPDGANDASEIDLDLKLGIMGLTLFDQRLPLVEHIAAGIQRISAGGDQLGFTGSIQIVDMNAQAVTPASIQSLTVGGVVFAPSAPPVVASA